MNHTPGPWKWFDYPDGRKLLAAAASRAVIHCADAPISCKPADERLISAAPELLAALKAMIEHMIPDNETVETAKAAIAKAEGQ